MASWRDEILKVTAEPVSFLYVISDPDGLLNDETILTKLQSKNIEMIEIEDVISFRYVFESKYRKAIYNREKALVVRTELEDFHKLPYDLLKLGSKHKISLSNIFPKLSYPIIKQLSTTDLDALYTVYQQYQGSSSDTDTIKFLLNRVYKIYPEIIESTSDFIKFLLSYHYQEIQLPEELEKYIIDSLNQVDMLNALPVKRLIQSRSYFYSYLQDEWDEYISQLHNESEQIKDPFDAQSHYHTKHSFSHPDVRRLLNDLFYENKLHPIKGYEKETLPNWTHPGIIVDEAGDKKDRIYKLLNTVREKLNGHTSYKIWIEIAKLYGELGNLFFSFKNELDKETTTTFGELTNQINREFEYWMFESYSTLYNIPYYPSPVMVDRIPHYLESLKRDKIALIVLDGMNFIQWSQVKQSLLNNNIQVNENGIFAWVPTLTSISRQAIFSGEIPMMFSDSIHTTNKEEKLWKTFWENHSISKQKVSYQRSLGQGDFNKEQIEALKRNDIRVAGLVVDTIDELTHGAIQGHKGMHAEIDIWLKNNYLLNLIRDLGESGYSIFITSDHGNTESYGNGRLSDGVLVQSKGERVRIYKDKLTRDERADEFSLLRWPNIGIPEDMHVLLANENKAFIPKQEQAVSHGSININEVIVPFVEVNP
ncbi:PglZ domain-containing protein [Lentibacillus halodurans]|uniref:PglZ domain-containing protein n=1 Tax=Lentibacillus halodurans TaxID=237679 RepID=A0A1I0W3L2_9BACI|nr:BREX-3 system phosphatase PglZ [Lentibacillus halodurans]SFA83222.1 PglZ domain-containing protein [Lentibacillus halodurans]